jgi:glucose-6-phosphate dehydrogenase assembly protein OpcA
MSESAAYLPAGAVATPLSDVEHELGRQMKALQGPGEMPVQIARMSNLVVFCDDRNTAEAIAAQVPEIVPSHPARVLMLLGEAAPDSPGVTASVLVRPLATGRQQKAYSEQVTLCASGHTVGRLSFAVRALLIGDLPTNLWWASSTPPAMAGRFLDDLAENMQQIVYDSLGWREPAKGVAATAAWLTQIEKTLPGGRWRVASDLNWRRLKYWRRTLAQSLEAAAAPGAVETATELLLEHGPHAVIQAWELASWLTRRLDWRVKDGRVEPGVEISWQFQAPQGSVTVRVRRLSEGPSDVRRVKLQCKLDGKPGAVVVQADDSRRLIVLHEGTDTLPRTATVQTQPAAELVARQLSDRERDPVFTESMAGAQALAQSLLG